MFGSKRSHGASLCSDRLLLVTAPSPISQLHLLGQPYSSICSICWQNLDYIVGWFKTLSSSLPLEHLYQGDGPYQLSLQPSETEIFLDDSMCSMSRGFRRVFSTTGLESEKGGVLLEMTQKTPWRNTAQRQMFVIKD
jgi:hypothetical protein